MREGAHHTLTHSKFDHFDIGHDIHQCNAGDRLHRAIVLPDFHAPQECSDRTPPRQHFDGRALAHLRQ